MTCAFLLKKYIIIKYLTTLVEKYKMKKIQLLVTSFLFVSLVMSSQNKSIHYSKSSNPTIELTASSDGVSVITTILYRDAATLGLDPGYDVGNFNGASFDVYTRLVDGSSASNFTYQALPKANYESMVIPVGLKANTGKEVVFNATNTNLPVNLEVFIEDRELSNYTLLDGTNTYTVTLNNAQDGIGRFYLHTRENQVIWKGNTNATWAEGTNWNKNSVPTNMQDVLVENTANNPAIGAGTSATMNSLRINNSSSLTIASGGSATITTDFVNGGNVSIASNNAASGTLLVKGISNGQVTYERGGLIANQWSIVSAPVSGQSVKDFVENSANNIRVNNTVTPNRYAVGYYDDTRPTGDKWVYYTVDDLASNSVTFEKGQSYAISRATNGSVTFTGTIETADVNKSVVVSEWNAIGNPYTAFLPINENSGTNFINDNLASFDPAYVGVYTWDNTQSKYIAKTLVSGESSLAPGQGFFVKITGSANNMAFKEAERMVQPATGGTFGKGSSIPTIELSIASKGVQVNTSISFRNNATSGLDAGYDVGNFDGASLDIYTRLLDGSSEKNFTYQSLPNNSNVTSIIPVGIKAKEGTSVTISGKGVSLPVEVEMYLEDRELEKFINLHEEDYSLTIGKAINGVGRFYLHTKGQAEIPEVTLAGIKLYNVNNTLFVEGVQGEQFEVTMYNTAGGLVYKDNFKGIGKNSIDLPIVAEGVYLIKVKTNAGTKHKKILQKKY